MTLNASTLLGFGGVLLLVMAYFTNQCGLLRSDDWRFPAANLLGSLLILVSLWSAWNLPSVVIEAIWITISLYGLVRCARRGR